MKKKRHEWWREMYRDNRDLDHLPHESLLERSFDCINNLSVNAGRGQVGIRRMNEPGSQWMQLWTEVLEEFQLRGIGKDGMDFSSHFESVTRLAHPFPNLEASLEKYSLKSQPYLLKFGGIEYMPDAMLTGQFRISSASSYDSYFKSYARHDRELTRTITPNPRDETAKKFAQENGWEKPPGHNISSVTIEAQTDYYLFSMCSSYSSRLFGDFHDEKSTETVCLLVHRPKEFIHKLGIELRDKLSTDDWIHKIGFVTYFDPVRVDPNLLHVTHCKPMRYAYQNEIRFTIIPKQPNLTLSPNFFIELGPLDDCAELITMESHPPAANPKCPSA